MAMTTEQMTKLYRNLIRADQYSKMMHRMVEQRKLVGFFQAAEGAIAPGVGACTFLNSDDNLSPHHRGNGITHLISRGIDVRAFIAEHAGKEAGCCRGRSTFHFSFPEQKVYLTSGFIGYNFPVATGWGWAAKRRNLGQVVMNCSGDGSYGQGRAHEALLMAMNWKLPIIFLCENNGMAIHSLATEMHPTEDISSLAQGYGMPAVIVDGQDVFAVAEVALAAIERARSGRGPTFVEAKTLRFAGHDVGSRDLAGWTPREEEEYAEMRKREPVNLATERVLAEDILTQSAIDGMVREAAAEAAEAEAFADASAVASPNEAELLADVFAP